MKALFKQFAKASRATKTIKKTADDDRVSDAFAEKIMLAVTGVNECVNCSYRHTKSALEQGVGVEEAVSILKGELDEFPEEEAVALLYAQHWSDTGGDPDENARKRVVDCYGEQKTIYIECMMQLVYTGNLISNTVEACRMRLRPQKGRFCFFLTVLLCMPIAFLIKSNTKSVQAVLKKKMN